MAHVRNLGEVYAWQDGAQWWYAESRDNAPENALAVRAYEVDGELILHHEVGAAGQFIRGAKPAASD
jgi:hypothetical protein